MLHERRIGASSNGIQQLSSSAVTKQWYELCTRALHTPNGCDNPKALTE